MGKARSKAAPRQKVRWAPRCQVWSAVGVGWRYLVILQNDTSITSETHIETLKEVDFPLIVFFSKMGQRLTLLVPQRSTLKAQ